VASDISYLKTGEGFLYLCVVKDILTGEILGQPTSERMKKELVIKAFLNAQARHPLGYDTIFHSDRGSRYTSKEFMVLLANYGIQQSFSRVAMPCDNTRAESFFASFKKERILFNVFPTSADPAFATFTWTPGFYNNIRVQKHLGYISPVHFTKSFFHQIRFVVA